MNKINFLKIIRWLSDGKIPRWLDFVDHVKADRIWLIFAATFITSAGLLLIIANYFFFRAEVGFQTPDDFYNFISTIIIFPITTIIIIDAVLIYFYRTYIYKGIEPPFLYYIRRLYAYSLKWFILIWLLGFLIIVIEVLFS